MQQALLQPPTAEPISLAQAKNHLREDETAQDELIERLIRSARQYVEDYTRRVMVRQVWRATYGWFPPVLELPILPVRSVSSVKYVDSAGATQTWAASTYQVDLITSDRARIRPVFGETWPTTQPDTFNAVTVEFVAGDAIPFTSDFGADANQLDATAHPLANADILQVWNTGGDLPNGLEEKTNYYVVNAVTDAFELSLTSGGIPIVLTTDGKGTQFAGMVPESLVTATLLLVGHWYENREQSIVGVLHEIPRGVDSLLLPYTSVRF